MSRGVGAFDPIQELVPEWMAILIGLVTQLGDVWFLSVVVAVLYWTQTNDRDEVAIVAATMLTGFAVIGVLKRYFALPRPDHSLARVETLPHLFQPLYEVTGTASGYGFPSGHAFMTTIVYLSLAAVLSVGTRRRRWAAAAGLVTIVCASRVALGVHYLVDVVAGVGFGILVLAFAKAVVRARGLDRGTAAFGLAAAASLGNLLHGGGGGEAALLTGAVFGAFAGWQLVVGTRLVADARPVTVLGPAALRFGAAAAVVVALLGVLGYVSPPSTAIRGAAVGLLTAGVVTLPALWHSERIHRETIAGRF